jgi:hypothetical protein
MSVQDGTYLIHSSGENIRNFYPVGEYEGAGIGTISGGSRQPPTEVRKISSGLYLNLLIGS